MPRIVKIAVPALILIGIVGLSFALLSATSKGGSVDPVAKLATGSLSKLETSNKGAEAPTSTFEGPDGKRASLQDFAGKTILVNFWATWCGPCEREMPSLAALQSAKGSDDFQVVVISVDSAQDKDYARERLQELSGGVLDFYFTPPENWEIVYDAGARGFPTSILYGPDSLEIARIAGEADWESYEAVALIDKITP